MPTSPSNAAQETAANPPLPEESDAEAAASTVASPAPGIAAHSLFPLVCFTALTWHRLSVF
jgi:hypothetical protein